MRGAGGIHRSKRTSLGVALKKLDARSGLDCSAATREAVMHRRKIGPDGGWCYRIGWMVLSD